jgi:hypothetical protein
MTRELDEQLFNDFEFFHPERSMRSGLMCFGFECGDGWYELIRELCEELKEMIPDAYEGEEEFEVVQVKEKFGGLRFYTNWATEEMYEKIEEAEGKSFKICEDCGQPGRVRAGGWIRTLCDYHAKKAGYGPEDVVKESETTSEEVKDKK